MIDFLWVVLWVCLGSAIFSLVIGCLNNEDLFRSRYGVAAWGPIMANIILIIIEVMQP